MSKPDDCAEVKELIAKHFPDLHWELWSQVEYFDGVPKTVWLTGADKWAHGGGLFQSEQFNDKTDAIAALTKQVEKWAGIQ